MYNTDFWNMRLESAKLWIWGVLIFMCIYLNSKYCSYVVCGLRVEKKNTTSQFKCFPQSFHISLSGNLSPNVGHSSLKLLSFLPSMNERRSSTIFQTLNTYELMCCFGPGTGSYLTHFLKKTPHSVAQAEALALAMTVVMTMAMAGA